MTVLAEKSTLLPIKLPLSLPSFDVNLYLNDFIGLPFFNLIGSHFAFVISLFITAAQKDCKTLIHFSLSCESKDYSYKSLLTLKIDIYK